MYRVEPLPFSQQGSDQRVEVLGRGPSIRRPRVPSILLASSGVVVDDLLEYFKEFPCPPALEGVDARPGRASASALEREDLGVEAVAAEAGQRPHHYHVLLLVEGELGVGDYYFTGPA